MSNEPKLVLRKLMDREFQWLYVLIADHKRVDSFIYKQNALDYAEARWPGIEVSREKLLSGAPRWPSRDKMPRRLPELERSARSRYAP